ncbi:MAG: hypothetical protein CMO35_09045 [Verrucomicrobiaceae bacterium]|jgi:hypothetical protein|nr:hypothetical protein [Verrucomicrobiaceae bacterium]
MKSVLGILALFAACWQSGSGCSLCTDFPGASGTLSPRLLEIASAIQHELDSGGLESNPTAPLPSSGRVLGYRMAGLLKSYPEWNESLELVLIDTGARFRYDPRTPDNGFEAVSSKSVVRPVKRWVTGLDVFHAILDGRMPLDTADVRGILVVEPWKEGELLGVTIPVPEEQVEEAGEEIQAEGSGVVTLAVPGVLIGLVLVSVALVMRTRKRSVFNA